MQRRRRRRLPQPRRDRQRRLGRRVALHIEPRHRRRRRQDRRARGHQRRLELPRRRIPPIGLLLHRPHHHRGELRRHHRRQRRRRDGEMLSKHDLRGPIERLAPREQPIHHRAKLIDIGRRTQRAAHDLLRRHIRHRPEHHALRRQRLIARLPIAQLGDAKVEQPRLFARAPLADHDVLGLEIPMDDAQPMRLFERVEHRRHQRDQPPRRERPLFAQHRLQGAPVDELLNHVVKPVGLDVEVEQPHGHRMPQPPLHPRLAMKARAQIGQRIGDDLDGDRIAQPQMSAPIDRAKAALADERVDRVATAEHPPADVGVI